MSTLKMLIDKIQADIADDKRGNDAHVVIAKVLKEKFDGKKITKRLATYVAEALGEGAKTLYVVEYGMGSLSIWNWQGLTYNDKISFLIGYEGNHSGSRGLDPYDPKCFEITDACHGEPAVLRNERRKALLDDPGELVRLSNAIDECRRNWAILKDIQFETPSYEARFDVLKMTGLEERRS